MRLGDRYSNVLIPVCANSGIAESGPVCANSGIAESGPVCAHSGIAESGPVCAHSGIAESGIRVIGCKSERTSQVAAMVGHQKDE